MLPESAGVDGAFSQGLVHKEVTHAHIAQATFWIQENWHCCSLPLAPEACSGSCPLSGQVKLLTAFPPEKGLETLSVLVCAMQACVLEAVWDWSRACCEESRNLCP